MPISLDGTLGTQAEKVQKFGTRLSEGLEIPVEFWDERFTTSEAEEILDQVNMNAKERKKVIDQVSAVIILDEYLRGNTTEE